ncbi:hypothetical protein DDE82_005789 [Stemphylium lycopersici]|nr:hypothetical protein DDE82_005789 [Stemphylium lycopersici]
MHPVEAKDVYFVMKAYHTTTLTPTPSVVSNPTIRQDKAAVCPPSAPTCPYLPNPLTVLLRLSISPILTKPPTTLVPCSPQPAVATQMPVGGTIPQLQTSLTHADPIGQPPSPKLLAWHLTRLVSSQLYAPLSKQIPLPSTVVAQMQVVVSLPEPHMRSKPQRESHAGEAQTPLTQSLPKAQALPHRPQCNTSVLVSWQPPLQSSMPGPVQMGGLGVALLTELVDDVSGMEDVVDVILVDETNDEEDGSMLLADEDDVLLTIVLDSLIVGIMLDDEETESELLTEDDDVLLAELEDEETKSELLTVVLDPLIVGIILDDEETESELLTEGDAVLLAELEVSIELETLLPEGVSDDVVSIEELVIMSDDEDEMAEDVEELLVPGSSSEVVDELVVAEEELSETVDGPSEVLDELLELPEDELRAVDVMMTELLDSLEVLLTAELLGSTEDEAELDDEMPVLLEDTALETMLRERLLERLLETADEVAALEDAEDTIEEGCGMPGQEVPVVTTVVTVVIAEFVTVYND